MVYGHTDLKKDVLIELDGVPYRVAEYSHHAMGRGGAVVQVKLKNLLAAKKPTHSKGISQGIFSLAAKVNS